MHAPIIQSALRRILTDPSEPDYPKGLFRAPGDDRPCDRAYIPGQRPFQIGKDLWAPGHLSSDDWPKAIGSPIYEWDPASTIARYEELSKGRAVRVTLANEAATQNNMALIGYFLDMMNRAPIKSERTDCDQERLVT